MQCIIINLIGDFYVSDVQVKEDDDGDEPLAIPLL
jgi:hypothetical protein